MSDTTQNEAPTITIFRKYRNGDVIALFPFELGDMSPATCLSYTNIGQHGSANDSNVVSQTKLATKTEYAPLKAELERIGYVIETRKRITSDAYQNRKNQLKAISGGN